MSVEEPNYEKKRKEQILGATSATELVIDKDISSDLRNGNDFGANLASRLELAYYSKANEISVEFSKMKDILDENTFLKYEKAMLESLHGRLNLLLKMYSDNGAKDISVPSINRSETYIGTMEKIDQMQFENGIAIIQNADVQALVRDALKGDDRKKYEDKVGHEIGPDNKQLLEKIVLGSDLKDEDWKMIVDAVIPSPSKTRSQLSLGVVLLSQLTPKLKNELLFRIKDKPYFDEFLPLMVENGNITPNQAEAFLNTQIAILEKDNKSDKKKIEALKNLQTKVLDPKMATIIEEKEKVREERVKYKKRGVFGHRNSARDLLSWRGIGSAIITTNGLFSMGANIAVSPLDAPFNPAFYFAAAQTLVGLQGTKGFGGAVPTPLQVGGKIIKDTVRGLNEEVSDKLKKLQKIIEYNPIQRLFYFTYADEISKQYDDKMRNENIQNPQITLKDMHVDYAKLPKRIRDYLSKEKLEETITLWARELYLQGSVGGASQRDFITKARKEISGIETPLEPFKKV
ncbi:MAG: hypothetical protein WC897_01355 [Candidatus Gracilibacteria bacterium]